MQRGVVLAKQKNAGQTLQDAGYICSLEFPSAWAESSIKLSLGKWREQGKGAFKSHGVIISAPSDVKLCGL